MIRKKLYAALLILTLLVSVSYSQGILRKWDVVIDDGFKSVSIDTTSILMKGKHISFWVQEEYANSQEFSESQLKIKKIKSQYLINPITSRYSVIGKLYYNDLGKVVGESSNPRLSGGGENFYLSIQPNSSEEMLLNRVSKYVNDESGSYSSYSQLQGEEQEPSDTSQLPDTDPILMVVNSADDEIQETDVEESVTDNTFKVPVRNSGQSEGSVRIYDADTGEYIELKDSVVSRESYMAAAANESVERPASKQKYNVSAERNVTSTIFTDGNLYCFQVSSWKTKSIADQEVERLKRAGHSAYLVAARPTHKRGTWHRVRVGYFNSLSEAKKAERSAK